MRWQFTRLRSQFTKCTQLEAPAAAELTPGLRKSAYDNLGRLTSASQTGNALTFGWDALSRKTSEAGPQGSVTFAYDAADRRTSITYPSTTALTVTYAYLVTGELDTIKQSTTLLADYAYDSLGNRTGVAFEGGAAQAFGYDPVSITH